MPDTTYPLNAARGGDPRYFTVSGAGAFAITPDNTASLTKATRGIWVGATGALKVDMLDGTTATFANIPDGTLLPIQATRVYATGTTAGSLVGLY